MLAARAEVCQERPWSIRSYLSAAFGRRQRASATLLLAFSLHVLLMRSPFWVRPKSI